MEQCGLCHLVRREILYEDEVCAVVTCHVCGVPMAVLKRHHATGTAEERRALRAALEMGRSRPSQVIDERMRSIPTHLHMHLRG